MLLCRENTKDIISKEDRLFLRKYHSKVYALGFHLLANDIRGDDFAFIMQGGENVAVNKKKERFVWLNSAMGRLEERLGHEKANLVRENSACYLGGMRHELAQSIHDNNDTIDSRFAALSQERRLIGGKAWKDEDRYYISYWYAKPVEGYTCSCLHYASKETPMNPLWCACCAGHIKHHFETALGVKCRVKCFASVLNSCGEKPCTFSFEILNKTDSE